MQDNNIIEESKNIHNYKNDIIFDQEEEKEEEEKQDGDDGDEDLNKSQNDFNITYSWDKINVYGSTGNDKTSIFWKKFNHFNFNNNFYTRGEQQKHILKNGELIWIV